MTDTEYDQIKKFLELSNYDGDKINLVEVKENEMKEIANLGKKWAEVGNTSMISMAESSERLSKGILEAAQHQQKMETKKMKMLDKYLNRKCLANNQSIKLENVHTTTEEIVLIDSDGEESMEVAPVREQPDTEDQSVHFNVPWEPGNQIVIPLATVNNLEPGRSTLIGELGHLLIKTKKGECKISQISRLDSDKVTKLEAAAEYSENNDEETETEETALGQPGEHENFQEFSVVLENDGEVREGEKTALAQSGENVDIQEHSNMLEDSNEIDEPEKAALTQPSQHSNTEELKELEMDKKLKENREKLKKLKMQKKVDRAETADFTIEKNESIVIIKPKVKPQAVNDTRRGDCAVCQKNIAKIVRKLTSNKLAVIAHSKECYLPPGRKEELFIGKSVMHNFTIKYDLSDSTVSADCLNCDDSIKRQQLIITKRIRKACFEYNNYKIWINNEQKKERTSGTSFCTQMELHSRYAHGIYTASSDSSFFKLDSRIDLDILHHYQNEYGGPIPDKNKPANMETQTVQQNSEIGKKFKCNECNVLMSSWQRLGSHFYSKHNQILESKSNRVFATEEAAIQSKKDESVLKDRDNGSSPDLLQILQIAAVNDEERLQQGRDMETEEMIMSEGGELEKIEDLIGETDESISEVEKGQENHGEMNVSEGGEQKNKQELQQNSKEVETNEIYPPNCLQVEITVGDSLEEKRIGKRKRESEHQYKSPIMEERRKNPFHVPCSMFYNQLRS